MVAFDSPLLPTGFSWRSLAQLNPVQQAQLISIEQASHHTPWSLAQFSSSVEAGHLAYAVTSNDEQVAAYAVLMPNADDWELLNITVASNHRGQGIAQGVLTGLIATCRRAGAQAMLLEVRASNVAAIALYTKLGFAHVTTRRAYYTAPIVKTAVDAQRQGREDALIFKLVFDEKTPAKALAT